MFWTVRRGLDCSCAKLFGLTLLLGLGIPPSYCQEKLQTPEQANEKILQLARAASARPVDTPIGSGDLLRIEVFDVPELSRDVRVNDTGEIGFPLIPGRIQAGGLTPFQLEDKLANLLVENGLISHPQVSVFVKEQNSQPISVIGAVNRPFVYQEIRPTTLLEVLAQAGGIADDAGSAVIITRPPWPRAAPTTTKGGGREEPPAGPETITIALKDLLESGNPSFNIPVYGGDVISVPRAGIVYVAGAVQQPGGFVLQSANEQMTVLKAVALAHGLLHTAKSNDAVIIRKDPATGQKQEISVRLKKIMQRKAEDLRLFPNDILFIPDSTGKRVLGRAGEVALSITSGLVILRGGR